MGEQIPPGSGSSEADVAGLRGEGEPCCICGDWIDEGLFRRTPDGRLMRLSCASGDPVSAPTDAHEKDD